MEQADLRGMFKMSPKSVCTSIIIVCPDPLSPTPSISLAMETPENTVEDRDDPQPADEGHTHKTFI